MFWFPTKKEIKKSFKKVERDINDLKLKWAQLEGSINVLLRKQLHEPTTRSNIEKKIKKRLDNIKLMKAISSCIKEGYSTTQIKEDIINRFKIKTTCFFKYLKLVREQLRVATTRSKNVTNRHYSI